MLASFNEPGQTQTTAFQALDTVNTERWVLVLPQGWTERTVTVGDYVKNEEFHEAYIEDECACRGIGGLGEGNIHNFLFVMVAFLGSL